MGGWLANDAAPPWPPGSLSRKKTPLLPRWRAATRAHAPEERCFQGRRSAFGSDGS